MLRGAPIMEPQPMELMQPVALPQRYASASDGSAAYWGAAAFVVGAAAAFTAANRAATPRMSATDGERAGPAPRMQATGALKLYGKDLVGASDEFFNQVWDPLNLASTGSEQTLAWYRHAELKHGRAAMLASVGYLVQVNHLHFPGLLSVTKNISFASLSELKPYEAWEAVPAEGKLQIALVGFALELAAESGSPDGHYMRGGTPGDLQFLNTLPQWEGKMSDAEYLRRQNAELKHGRAAMIFLASLIAANNIPGSVPALTAGNPFLG